MAATIQAYVAETKRQHAELKAALDELSVDITDLIEKALRVGTGTSEESKALLLEVQTEREGLVTGLKELAARHTPEPPAV